MTSLFVTSKNADYVSPDGSSFRVRFDPHLQYDGTLVAKVTSAVNWFVFPNVTNGTLRVRYNGATYDIPIPTGLYELNTLRDTVYRGFTNASLPINPILFEQNDSTQKVIVIFNHGTSELDFTGNAQMATLLGFEQQNYTAAQTVLEAPNTARFNTIESLQLHSNMTNTGIPVNGKYYQTIATIPITARVGGQNIYQPMHPQMFECRRLNSPTEELHFWLTSEDGTTLLNTLGESWELTIQIDSV